MKVGILGQRGGWHTTALQAALRRRKIEAPALPITRLQAGVGTGSLLAAGDERLEDYDLLFVRAIPGGSLEQIIFRMDALHRLEQAGVRIVNGPKVIERTVDKYYTSALLAAAGLPTPPTIVTEQFEEAMAAFEALGGDVVVKPLFGSEGRGMVRVSDPDTAYRVLRALEMGRYVFYLQAFVPHGLEDLRLFCLGGRVLAAMRRRGSNWKTNVAQGAAAEAIQVEGEPASLALRAAAVLAADYAGVDILPLASGGYTVIEINGIPGWRGLQAATGVDAADHLVAHVLEEMA